MAYALAHAAVDFACMAFLLSLERSPLLFLIYNFCAFALQMPMGLLVGRHGRAAALLGCGLTALGICCGAVPLLGATIVGVGNAAFHIGGGAVVLRRTDKFGPLGIFVAPGAIGLYLGALLPTALLPWIPLLALAVSAAAICTCTEGEDPAKPQKEHPRAAVWAVGALLLVVVLRSLLGMSVTMPWKPHYGLAAALVTAGGKAAGGLLADRFGLRPVAVGSLLLSAICFAFADFAPFGLAALFLFQMTMPLTLGAAARWMPDRMPFAFGLMTFGLFLGFLPVLFGLSLPLTAACVGCVVSLALLLPAGKEVGL